MEDRAGVGAVALAILGTLGAAILLVQAGRASASVDALNARLDKVRPAGRAGKDGAIQKAEAARLDGELAALKAAAEQARRAAEGGVRITGPDGKPMIAGADLKALAAKTHADWEAETHRAWADRQVSKMKSVAAMTTKNRAEQLKLSAEQQEKMAAALNDILVQCQPILRLESVPDDIPAWIDGQLAGFEQKMREVMTPEQYKAYSRHPVNIIGGLLYDAKIPRHDQGE
ncbi:MAG: hypothetical protein AAB074_22085 [Planctomycetota bacterium]